MWVLRLRRSSFRCRARRHFFSRLSVVFFLATALWDYAGAQARSKSVEPRTLIELHIDGTDSLALTLSVSDAAEAEILIQTSTPGVQLVVLSPSGHPLKTATSDRPEWLAFSFRCVERGEYRLTARMMAVHDEIGGASLRVDLLTFPATRADGLTNAEFIFAEAQSLANSPLEAPVRNSIAKFRQAGRAWAAIGDREGELLALGSAAQASLNLSDYSTALISLDRAMILSAKKPFFRAWLANLEARVYLDGMDSKHAKRHADEAVYWSRGLDDEWLNADSLANRAESEYLIRAPSEHDDIQKAIQLSTRSHAVETLARALRCRAWIEQDAGRMTQALGLLQRAEYLFQMAGESRDAAIGMSDLANNQEMSGDPYIALVRQSSLVSLIRKSGKLTYLEYLLTCIAQDYAALNRIPDAIVYSKEALQTSRKIKHPSGEMGDLDLGQLCELQVRIGHLREALSNCHKSLAIVEQIHDPKRIAIASWQLANVLRALDEPNRAIVNFKFSSRMSESVHDKWIEQRSLIDWGETLEGLGKHEKAQLLFEKALSMSQAVEDATGQLEARYQIARTEFQAGQTEQAKRDLKIVLENVEGQRRAVFNADLQASYFAQLHKCHELFVELLMREHEGDPTPDDAAQALEVSESGRALTLLDALAARDSDSSVQQQVTTTQELMELHGNVQRAYDERLKLMLEGSRKNDMDRNAIELTQAINTLERSEDEHEAIAKFHPPLGRTLSAGEIAAASQTPQTTLIEYALGPEHSYVWVINGGKLESHVLPARDRIESTVKEWRVLATARNTLPGESFGQHRRRVEAADKKLPQVGADLSCMLLAPFLLPGMKHLTIVPDGALELLPFAALPEDGCQGSGQPLAAEREVSIAPSLSVLLRPHQNPIPASFRGEVALLADPVFDRDDVRVHRNSRSSLGIDLTKFTPVLPRLIGTRDEAKAIIALAGPERAALYVDFDASLKTLFSPSLTEYKILHLATHGVLDEGRRDFSGIVLSLVSQDGQPVFGYLNAHDIASLSLRFELVVLSSCDSAGGVNLSGEGVTGLNRAFLSAGAKRVVSTVWTVDDEATKELMTTFYSGMLRDGLDPPEALRRSQLKMMRSSRMAAPYYWAGFILTSTIF